MSKNSHFSNILILWYLKNKRDLPWRKTKDPYLIWLSEIILQQTRISQGTAYYLKFLEIFPNIKLLAKA
ncbi:MAG: A/G-specific adenine glycosylase, partial [Flavobacteriaceae bacterium]|nr:A/G-specific adenine glycosylase [Flavobacteriaceae bacterium]